MGECTEQAQTEEEKHQGKNTRLCCEMEAKTGTEHFEDIEVCAFLRHQEVTGEF